MKTPSPKPRWRTTHEVPSDGSPHRRTKWPARRIGLISVMIAVLTVGCLTAGAGSATLQSAWGASNAGSAAASQTGTPSRRTWWNWWRKPHPAPTHTTPAPSTVAPTSATSTSTPTAPSTTDATATSSAAPVTGLPSRAGNVGTNLAGIADWSTEFPFVDLMKQSRAWVSQKAGASWGKGDPLALRSDGWPARLAADQSADRLIIMDTGGHTLPGRYTVIYTGTGEFTIAGHRVSATGGTGQLPIDLTKDSTLTLSLTRTDTADPVRDVHVVLAGHESTYLSRPFTPLFLERTKSFTGVRFMDWMQTNGNLDATWADAPKVTDISYADGVPVEVMVQLANALHADPWFNLPAHADDAYVKAFAQAVKKDLDPTLKVYLEYSNETWNWQFEARRYTTDRGRALGLGDDNVAAWRYHAIRAKEIFSIFGDAFGEHPEPGKHGTRLVRVLATQVGWIGAGPTEAILAEGAKEADALAVAPYFGCADLGTGAGNQTQKVLSGGLDVLLNSLCPDDIKGTTRNAIQNAAKLAKAAGLELVAYEGGQSLQGTGANVDDQRLTDLLTKAADDPRMEGLYRSYFAQWKELGGGRFMNFSDVGLGSKWGQWGVLRYLDQPLEQAHRYRAVVAAAG